MSPCSFVLDIGKTHIKAHVIDAAGDSVASRETLNRVQSEGVYPHYAIDAIWRFLLDSLESLNRTFPITAIAVTTHGAAAALVDRERGGDGLILPVLDYEFVGIESIDEAYRKERPDFSETGSPELPAGLNLGRQLAWLEARFPVEFAAATDILMYPQYWVWRLCGERVSEVSSLGCHTDLWAPWEQGYSSLVTTRGWTQKFPRLVPAWENVGRITATVAAQTGLSPDCAVIAGVHDSNASYLRYRRGMPERPFSVVSTGTWAIVMDSSAGREKLDAERDMLANVDVYGRPFVCSRFMGGREYQAICEFLGGDPDAPFSTADILAIIAAGLLCLPTWQAGSGPFSQRRGRIQGAVAPDTVPAALASLYCALVLDYQLELLGSSGDIVIGGAFLKNAGLCGLLAKLREPQQLLCSADLTGTVQGTAMLTRWEHPARLEPMQGIEPVQIDGLAEYRALWRESVLSFAN
ncbi:FGGY-family carbohydrate kinase [Haliea sp. E17]|uniref:FGGY-family carbohydrate kinase n=1 Tax=Haliea sp. E17 TaxID=3401576 RepID=UPI003AAAE987